MEFASARRDPPTVAAGLPDRERLLPVLIVDDNEADRRLATIQLGTVWPFECDLKVECAASGPEALDKIRTGGFKLIVLDWKMPGIGGGDVLRLLVAHGVRAPVLVMSSLSREELLEDIEGLGAAFISKEDLSSERFSRAVAQALAVRQRRPQVHDAWPEMQVPGPTRLPASR